MARVGRVEKTGDLSMPFRRLDDRGAEIVVITEFLHHMLADDASPVSLRSYAYELLSWHRFLRAIEVPWHLAGRVDVAISHCGSRPARSRRGNAAPTRQHQDR